MIAIRSRIPFVTIDRPSGNSSHYYHFVLDVLLPLFRYSHRYADEIRGERVAVLLDPPAAHFRGLLREALDLRVVIPWARVSVGSGARIEVAVSADGLMATRKPRDRVLRTMDPRHRGYRDNGLTRKDFESFCARVREILRRRLGVASAPPNAVVLIERGAGHDRGAGRRSIENHDEIRDALAGLCSRRGVVLENRRLEGRSLATQMQLFARARCVVGQHGAGLVNLLWSDPCCNLVELDCADARSHFDRLAEALGRCHERVISDRIGAEHAEILHANGEAVTAAVSRALDRSC